MAHKHAENMALYAQDAAKTDKPWERWEVRMAANVQPNAVFERLSSHPEWHTSNEYRRKPQTIKVGKWEFPKPISIIEIPAIGAVLYLTKFSTAAEAFTVWHFEWDGDNCDMVWLKGGMLHFTREAAQSHADVLNAICRGDVE